MPKPSAYMLIWIHEQEGYELHLHGQLQQCFQRGDDDAFFRWLEAHTAFAFVGQSGRISAIKESRPGGTGYWYAYRTNARHTRKRYLGPSARVTFARLEQEAQVLSPSDRQEVTGREGKKLASLSQAEYRSPLLSLRLSPPHLPNSLVERSRLFDELDAVFSHPLTLVSAAAGSGKTTLLSAWMTAKPQVFKGVRTKQCAGQMRAEPACAWLSLDEPDNDPIHFWLSVIAAIRTCLPACGEAAQELLRSPEAPPLSTILTALLEEMAQVDREIILILDDYHVIADQAIHDSLLAFLDHAPANVHLVLATRTNPALPLARFRVRSQMLEIREQDLRFTNQEATSFLVEGMGLPLSEDEVATLAARTEGWIAGLQLASLALRKRQDLSSAVSDFGGSHRYLLDYVQQDILAHLPATLQDFLLQTSILPRVNAALCQMVTAAPDEYVCQQMLEELERANLFVVPLDEQRQWYRFHDLFREALRTRLHASHPQLLPLLHVRAARWYEWAGELREAIAHALAAPDYSFAATLMEQAAELFWVRGEATTMARWVLELPEPVVREHARLVLTTALYLLHTVTLTTQEQREKRRKEVQRLMARVETAILLPQADETSLSREVAPAGVVTAFSSKNETFAAEEALLQRRLRLLRTGMAWYEALAAGEDERWSTLYQEMQELDQDEEVIWQLLPLGCSFVFHYAIRQEGALLVSQLREAKQRMSRSGSHLATTRVRQWLAMVYVVAGQLRQAYEESLNALDLIERISGYTLLKGYFELVLIQVLYQWNRLEEARDRVRTVIEDAATWQHSDLLLSGYLALMQVELARGDLSAVQQALQGFEQLDAYHGYGYHWRWLPTLRAQWWLAQAQVNKASTWAADVIFPQGAWDGSLYAAFPVVIRVYFAQRSFREALELLDSFREHLDRPGNLAITISYLAQSLVALHQVGKSDQASEVAARLFALTEPEGYLRVYLDEGEPMRQALLTQLTSLSSDSRQHPRTASTMAYVSRVLAAFEQKGQPPPLAQEALSTTTHRTLPHFSQKTELPLLEPLSHQEQRVLRLLVAGQTYAEMAEALIVSPNTIKTQVSSIYRKLGVSRRAEAIALASRLHMLSFE